MKRAGQWVVWTLATIGLGVAVIAPAGIVHSWVNHRIGLDRAMAMPWYALYIDHAVMTLVALGLIALLSKGRMREYGWQRPEGESYVLASIGWGIFFGILMTVADYWPSLLAHKPPENYSLTPSNLTGWLFFGFVYVGFTEEIPFRGLLQTFLMQRTTGAFASASTTCTPPEWFWRCCSRWRTPVVSGRGRFGSRWPSRCMPSRLAFFTLTGGKNPAASRRRSSGTTWGTALN
jgi:membrane protease YdiL (CAAX protease family)